MRVIQVQGEPTRYHVESTSLECPACQKLFPRLSNPRNSALRVGDQCPKCSGGKLDVRFHLVDVAVDLPFGKCSCEYHTYTLGPKIRKLTAHQRAGLTQRQQAALRCSHLEAARTAAIDLTISAHESERTKLGNGALEEQAP